MPDWTELLDDSRTIRAIFGDACPSLAGVSIHEIVLHRDGPTVALRFDLPEFPRNPPAKWRDAGFNRVQVRLLAFLVKEVDLRGLTTEPIMDLEISHHDQLVRIRGRQDGMMLNIASEFIRIPSEGVTAYLDSEDS